MTYQGKHKWRVVHERVETAQLGDGHQATGREESTEVCGDNIALLKHPPLGLSCVQLLGHIDVVRDVLHLVVHILLRAVGEDLAN
jgi:hypothetical protein